MSSLKADNALLALMHQMSQYKRIVVLWWTLSIKMQKRVWFIDRTCSKWLASLFLWIFLKAIITLQPVLLFCISFYYVTTDHLYSLVDNLSKTQIWLCLPCFAFNFVFKSSRAKISSQPGFSPSGTILGLSASSSSSTLPLKAKASPYCLQAKPLEKYMDCQELCW